MSYLVIELQKDALDQSISTTNLLRKALVVAKKLKIADFENWINLELNGYYNTETDEPEYRNVHGQLKGLNPYHGWMPTSFNGDKKMQELLSSRKVADPITELEYLMGNNHDSLCLTYPANIEKTLGEMFGFETKFQLFINKSQIQGILEAVKTTILNWALELESDGILGEQMIFSEKEKEIAEHKNYTVNNFYGDVINSQIQQHSQDSSQEHIK